LFAANQVVENHGGGEEQEEGGEKRHDEGEIGGGEIPGDGECGEAVGQQHGQVVEQRPVAFAGNAEHAESQQEEIAEQAGEIRFAGGQQDGGGVAAQNAEDGDQQGVEADGEETREG
jgi:hypothetical protein